MPVEVDWLWALRPEDLEGIEEDRQGALKSPLYSKVTIRGIVHVAQAGSQTSGGSYPVTGEGNFEVPVSEWSDYLGALGYGVPPTVADVVGSSGISHPTWNEAGKRLEAARRHLRAGDDYVALTACLGEFEKLVSKPYVAESWKPLVATYPEQKQDGITRVLASHCTYLNKVGHHKDRNDRDAMGDLQEMPLNHWEAELAVAASQIWLTYALRLQKL